MSNQYTQARDAGITPDDPEWPKQAETRREHPEEVRAAIRASHAVRFLQSILDNEEVEVAHRISASKILLDKTIASLSAVDQTVRDERDVGDPSLVEAKLRMLVGQADPALLSRILGERARSLQAMPSPTPSAEDEAA